jgi:hypothetical protein
LPESMLVSSWSSIILHLFLYMFWMNLIFQFSYPQHSLLL